MVCAQCSDYSRAGIDESRDLGANPTIHSTGTTYLLCGVPNRSAPTSGLTAAYLSLGTYLVQSRERLYLFQLSTVTVPAVPGCTDTLNVHRLFLHYCLYQAHTNIVQRIDTASRHRDIDQLEIRLVLDWVESHRYNSLLRPSLEYLNTLRLPHLSSHYPTMPIRNPFAKRPLLTTGAEVANDENVPPSTRLPKDSYSGFERVDTVGSRTSSAWSIHSSKSRDNGDYKMSDEKGLWPRRLANSRTSMDTRSSIGDIEHFSISRESFDSYRRSFSPVLVHDVPRQSLDSASMRYPRSSVRHRSFERELPTAEEGFEDVGLNDDQKQTQQQHPKKKGFFAKFSEPQESNTHGEGLARFIPGRKRAQSGQGAELGPVERPKSSQSVQPQEVQ
ncbi:hypothetical protein CHU98_g7829 [Xylaria longipes]|nr:hypothetical protein CHU98_g7829 [Xylaria longipes]